MRADRIRVPRPTAWAGVLAGLLAGAGRSAAAQAPLGPATTDSPVSLERGVGFFTVDLTKAHEKTEPVIRFGYQSLLGDATRAARRADPESDVHNVPYYSVSVTGVPSGDVATMFSSGSLSTGADLQLSYGQAYVFSYVASRDASVIAANLVAFTLVANTVERLRDAIDAAPNTPQNRARIATWRDTIAQQTDGAARRRARRAAQLTATTRSAVRAQYQGAIEYADRVIAYGQLHTPEKPPAVDPLTVLERGHPPVYDAWFVRLGANAGSATFFDASKPFASQFSSRSYQGYAAQAGYSVRFGGALPFIVAASGGVVRSSNVDELGSVTVTETQTFTSTDGTTTRTTAKKRTGLVGTFTEETRPLAKLDAVFYPGLAAASRVAQHPRSTIALDLFGRATRAEPFVYGVGAYLTKPGSPTSVYGGANLYRATDRKLAVDLVVGFPF